MSKVALVRMTSDGALPREQRRHYSSVFNALNRITSEEGYSVLWRGATPTVCRAMVVNAAQLASYSQAKQAIKPYFHLEDGVPLHFAASLVSGLVTTVASLPVDLAKTRMQNMLEKEYKNGLDVIVKVVQQEGFLKLWRGFLPYYLRCAPHTVNY